jgi:GH24 family phage-related lysozyme (muramidase)
MHPSVLAAFPTFSDKLEGHCDCMYLDVRGLVTTGRGNLIDPMGGALLLPWTVGDGGPVATQEQITDEWLLVKSRTDLAGTSYPTRRAITTLRLSNEAIDALTDARLKENEAILAPHFPAWDSVPADAQLARHSVAWACGAASPWPKLDAAIRAGDYETAAAEVGMSQDWRRGEGTVHAVDSPGAGWVPTNPGILPRNAVNRRLLLTAAKGLQPFDRLHYLDAPANIDPDPGS